MANTISQSTEFYDIFNKSLLGIINVENSVLCLDKLESEFTNQIWEDIYLKVNNWSEATNTLKEYQIILLKRINKKEEYLKRVLSDFEKSGTYKSIEYFKSVNELKKLEEKGIFTFALQDKLPHIKTSVEDFISFVRLAKKSYDYYNISCDNNELDKYLSEIPASEEELSKIDFINIINSEYKLEKFILKIEENINIKKTSIASNKEIIEILFKLYKESCISKTLEPLLEDAQIYTIKNELADKDDFYYDICCMRLAKLNDFQSNYRSYFNEILNLVDKDTVEKISSKIHNYIDYDDMLLNLESFNSPLYNAVCNNLVLNFDFQKRLDLGEVLKKFKSICDNGNINPIDLIKSINQWNNNDLNLENIKSTIPDIFFFENAIKIESELSNYCIDGLKNYLNKKDLNEWKIALKDENSYEFKAVLLLNNYLFTQEAVDAIKLVLNDITDGIFSIPKKNNWNNIITKLKIESLEITFKDLRDRFVSNHQMNVEQFKFFGSWLFSYGYLEDLNDVLRKFLTTEIIRNTDCRVIISQNKEKLKLIFDNNNENAKTEFKATIRSILDSNSAEEDAIKIIAKELGVRQSKRKDDEKEG